MLALARPAATPSSSSPTRKRKTTTAASSAAPMKTAPTAATVISISIEKGVPRVAAVNARLATGTRPTSIARMKAADPISGNSCPATKAAAIARPQAMVSAAFRPRHHAPSIASP